MYVCMFGSSEGRAGVLYGCQWNGMADAIIVLPPFLALLAVYS